MREEKNARTRGKVCVEDISRANLCPSIGEARERAKNSTAVSNLSVQKYIMLSYSSRKRIDLKKTKKV